MTGSDIAPAPPRCRRVVAAWLAALALLFAAVPGLIGHEHPPQSANPDEWHFVPVAMKTANDPRLHPKIFINPSAPIYAYTAWLGVRYAAGRASGDYASARDFAFEFVVDETPAYHWCRLLNALCGLAAVGLLAYVTARRFGGVAGFAAGGLLGLSPLLQGKLRVAVDEPMLVLVCVAVLGALWRARDRRSARWFLAAGLLVGVAAGTKYNGAVLGLPWLLTGLSLWRAGTFPFRVGVGSALLIPTGFLLTTPHALLDWPSFSSQVIYNRGQLGADGPFWEHLGEYLTAYGTGFLVPGAWLLAVGGWLLAWRRATPNARRLLGTTLLLGLALAVYLARGRLATPRYAFPVQPWLAASAGIGIAILFRRARELGRIPQVLTGLACGSVLALGVVQALGQGLRIAGQTARFDMTRWVRTHTRPGDRILTDWYGPLLPLTEHVERFPDQLARADGSVHHLRRHPLYDYVRKGLNPLPEGGSPLDIDALRSQGYRYVVMNGATWKRLDQPDAHPDLVAFVRRLDTLPAPVVITDATATWTYRVYEL